MDFFVGALGFHELGALPYLLLGVCGVSGVCGMCV